MVSLSEQFPEFDNAVWTFKDRGTPIHSDLRPIYRISMILLILEISSNKAKSSLSRLHIIDWALKNDRAKDEVVLFLNKARRSRNQPIRYDPALLRAVQFAVADGLLLFNADRVSITEKGNIFVKSIISDKGLFAEARKFLNEIGKKFSEPKATKFIQYRGTEWL